MRFLREKGPQLLTALVALVLACALAALLTGADRAVPENPAEQANQAASHVPWTGEGYTAPAQQLVGSDDAQEQPPDALTVELPPEPEPPEPEEPDEPERPDEPDSTTEPDDEPAESGESEDGEPREGDEGTAVPGEEGDEGPEVLQFEDDPAQVPPEAPADDADDDAVAGEDVQLPPDDPEVDPNEGKYPEIWTDLLDNEVIGQDWRTFTVRATDYQGRTLGSKKVRVTANDARLYATADDGYEIRYRLPVDAADVAVSIRATDAKGRSTILDLTVHRSEEDAEQVVDGTITLSVEAGTVGLGTLLGPMQVDFYEGEQLPSVLGRALGEHGFGMVYKGSLDRGFHLQHITRAGITDGWEIPEALLAHLEEAGYTPSDYHQDSLGEYDFSGTSGWMYSVNDVYLDTGMASYYPADGDEVRVRFTLYRGSDIGGASSGGGPVWDEEW